MLKKRYKSTEVLQFKLNLNYLHCNKQPGVADFSEGTVNLTSTSVRIQHIMLFMLRLQTVDPSSRA